MKIATLGFTSLLIVCTACSKGTFDDSTPGDGTGDRDAGLDPAQGGDAAVSPSRDASMHADGGADGGGDGGLRCADLTCTTQNDCSVGSCEEKIGCVYGPAPDGTACGDTSQQTAGECVGGKCSILPQCWGSSPLQFLSCGAGSRDNSTVPDPYTKNRVNDYPCAPGESGAEVGYQFMAQATGDVSLSLSVRTGPDVDLDLIVLESACTSKARCSGQGLSAGTGTEKVTFHAVTGKTYYVVVDGKNAAGADFHLDVSCP